MKVNPVLTMMVAVLVSSALEYGEALASVELCEQIRSNQLRILTMGARGKSLDDAHFYILVEGGNMFKVPLSNLRVDAENRTTSITIDRDFIRVDALFNVSHDLFTRKYRFFFISNQNRDAFLCRMSLKANHSEYQLYDLNGALSTQDHPRQYIDVEHYQSIHVMSSIGINSNITYGLQFVDSKQLLQEHTFEVNNKDELKLTSQNHGSERYLMEFSSTTGIVTVFYHQENPKKEDGCYYFLDVDGLVTVTRRNNSKYTAKNYKSVHNLYSNRFEVNLGSFVVCDFKQTTNSRIDWTYWIIALCSVAFVGLGGVAIYFYCAMKKEKAKRRDLKKKNKQNKSNLSSFASSNLSSSSFNSSNLNSSSISSGTSSSNASSNAFTLTSNPTTTSSTSMASKGSSVLQSVKSSISSLLNRNKSKQAKTVVKAKNSKAKAKKPKSPK